MTLETPSDNQFGTTTTDIENQSGLLVISKGVGNTQIDQTGLLNTGNDFEGLTQNSFRFIDKIPGVFCRSQGIGANHPDVSRTSRIEYLAELPQTIEASGNSCLLKPVFFQARSKLHSFPVGMNRTHLSMLDTGNQQVKTVGTQIYRCDYIL